MEIKNIGVGPLEPDAMPVVATQHTPGPWTVEPVYQSANGDYYVFADKDHDSHVATVINRENKNATANARLIAAAPELLAALHRMIAVYEALMPGIRNIAVQDYREINEAPIAARTAIAKAEGRDS